MGKINELKDSVGSSLTVMFVSVIKLALKSKPSQERIDKLKSKFKGLPRDDIADILIKRAVRKNTVHGAINGAFITGAEVVARLPIPHPVGKALAIFGTGAAIVEDATFSTKTQMQLILDLSEVYDCSYDTDDEDDVWLIFKIGLGITGSEKAAKYAGLVFSETAKKQFRVLLRLRTGRAKLQALAIKVAGKQVGNLLAEKYVMKLVPFATIVLRELLKTKYPFTYESTPLAFSGFMTTKYFSSPVSLSMTAS